MLRKNSNFRPQSPIRSPIKINGRPVSPFRTSPFTRQAPMSPLKVRTPTNSSTTPTKMRPNQRMQLNKSPQIRQDYIDIGFMQKTLKTGVGLFQQLANQNKIGSEKKENRVMAHNTNPFEYSQKKRQMMNYPKNSFAALIQNVKQIESIQASKGHYFSNQVSFKTIEKSNMESTVKNEPIIKSKNSQHHQPVSILQSFGSSCQVRNDPQEPEKAIKQQMKRLQVVPVVEAEELEEKSRVEQQPLPPKRQNPEIIESFEDVILLIRKASQKVKDECSVGDEEVRMSFEQQLSFNMNPFL